MRALVASVCLATSLLAMACPGMQPKDVCVSFRAGPPHDAGDADTIGASEVDK